MATSAAAAKAPPRLTDKANSKSRVWKYFVFEADHRGVIIDSQKPICKRCHRTFQNKRGNTLNLAKHLKDRHPDLFKSYCCILFCCYFYVQQNSLYFIQFLHLCQVFFFFLRLYATWYLESGQCSYSNLGYMFTFFIYLFIYVSLRCTAIAVPLKSYY